MFKDIPLNLLLPGFGIVAGLVLLIPIALRLAGLTGEQISSVITQTLQFFITIVKEFRAQNKTE